MHCPERWPVATVVLLAIAIAALGSVPAEAGNHSKMAGTPANDSGPFRILASDDADPNRTVSDRTTWAVDGGALRQRTREGGPPTYLLDGMPPSATDLAPIARATDGARTTLHRPVHVPVADDWQPFDSAPANGVRVIADPQTGRPGSPSKRSDGPIVAARNAVHGHWMPVRNATVHYDDETGYEIENPQEATVNVGTYRNYSQRVRAGQRSLLRTADDPGRFSVPTRNGTPITAVGAGGRVPTRWAGASSGAIRNHWVTVPRASPGAFDGDRLLVGDDAIDLFVAGDFTGQVPPAWSDRESCSPRGGTRRRWERWSISGVDRSVENGSGPLRRVDPGIYRLPPPASETLTIEHTASLAVDHEWGVENDCGPDRRGSETTWVNHTIETNVPLRRVQSEELSVTAFVLDRPDRRDEVHYHVEGNAGLTRGGLGSVTLSSGSARHTWQTPWTFYPVRTHDAVRLQRRNGSTITIQGTGVGLASRYPNVYRDRVEAETQVVTANDLGFVPTVESTGAGTANRALGPTVRTAPVANALYTQYGGTVSPVGGGSIANATLELTARNVLGEPVETHLRRRRYRATALTLRADGRSIAFRLSSSGTGLRGRALRIHGAKRRSVVTNETGWVEVQPSAPVVTAAFEGTPYLTERAGYYSPDRASIVVPEALRQPVWSVSTAIFTAVGGATAVSGWLAIGWCLRWQRRRRPDR